MKCKLAADSPSDILPCFAGNINKGFFLLDLEMRGILKTKLFNEKVLSDIYDRGI